MGRFGGRDDPFGPRELQRGGEALLLRDRDGGMASATIGRRFGTVAGRYKYAVLNGHVPTDPTLAVTRPRIDRLGGPAPDRAAPTGARRTPAAARHDGPQSHALVALLGMLGLGVSEACGADVTDLHYDSGYELLTIMGKGRKPAQIPLPVRVLRAVHESTGERTAGPILLNRAGARTTPASAAGRLRQLAGVFGLAHPISPRSLRRTFCTAGLVSGIPLRDMQ